MCLYYCYTDIVIPCVIRAEPALEMCILWNQW